MQMRVMGQISLSTTNKNRAIDQSNLGEYFLQQFIVYHWSNIMCTSYYMIHNEPICTWSAFLIDLPLKIAI